LPPFGCEVSADVVAEAAFVLDELADICEDTDAIADADLLALDEGSADLDT